MIIVLVKENKMEHKTTQLLDLNGKVAVVTGSGGGIGLGIAKRLHDAGANVVLVDLHYDNVHKSADELHALRAGSAYAVHADVANEEDVLKVISETINNFSKIDILVNNAGIFPMQPLSSMTTGDFDKVIATNLRSVFLFTKHVSEKMKQQGGGKIINITSIDAVHPSMIGLAHYDASKHGVWGFTKNSARELAEHKIWVNAVAPGGVATPGVAAMQDPNQAPDPETAKANQEAFLARIPMHRMGEPDDIAKAVLFLASEMSSYMTGSQVVVDGGALLM